MTESLLQYGSGEGGPWRRVAVGGGQVQIPKAATRVQVKSGLHMEEVSSQGCSPVDMTVGGKPRDTGSNSAGHIEEEPGSKSALRSEEQLWQRHQQAYAN